MWPCLLKNNTAHKVCHLMGEGPQQPEIAPLSGSTPCLPLPGTPLCSQTPPSPVSPAPAGLFPVYAAPMPVTDLFGLASAPAPAPAACSREQPCQAEPAAPGSAGSPPPAPTLRSRGCRSQQTLGLQNLKALNGRERRRQARRW